MAKILLVDDEPSLVDTVGYNLRKEGHQVISSGDGLEAVELTTDARPELVILDVMLPSIDGFEVCRRIRVHSAVPIIMLSAKDDEVDRVIGLEIGADDYLSKPFSMRELLARVKAMLRRSSLLQEYTDLYQQEILKLGELEISLRRREVICRGKVVSLKPKEFDLLTFLAAHPGRVFSREQLLTKVWAYEFSGDTRTVDVHIKTLREKLDDDAYVPTWIETVRGVGYRLRKDGV